jgi:hypothetical protein
MEQGHGGPLTDQQVSQLIAFIRKWIATTRPGRNKSLTTRLPHNMPYHPKQAIWPVSDQASWRW